MRRTLVRILQFVAITVIVMGFSTALHAQNATILGTVYDHNGLPMPGVTVVLTNKSTGFLRIATTGGDGSYSIPEVPPAPGYSVTANKEGQDLDTRDNIEVNVGDERSILPPLREPAPPAAPAPTPVEQPTTTQPAAGQPAGGQPAPTGAAPPPVQAAPTPAVTQPAAAAIKPPKQPKYPNATVRPEKTQTSLGGVITGDQLRTLPLYNRNFLVLGLITPNTHDVEAGSPLTGASFSIAGMRPSQNQFLLDGMENVASSSNQAIPFQVNDAIQEFRVTSSTANAEYGRGAGGIVSVVTRRGTNALHGAAFGYFANDIFNSDSPLSVYKGSGFDRASTFAGPLNAAALAIPATVAAAPSSYNEYVATARAQGYCTNSIAAPSATPNTCVATAGGRNDLFDPATILATNDKRKAPFRSLQFGANAGGAIIKDKLFAFGSYEATNINNPNQVFERVPSAFDRTVRNAADPNYTIANKIVNLYPVSNVVAVPGALEFFRGEADNYINVNNALIRMDWQKSQKNLLGFRYAGQLISQLHDETVPRSSTYAGNGAYRNAQNQNGAFTWNHTLNPKVLNEMRLGFTQFRVQETPRDQSFDAKTLGLASSIMPTIALSGIDPQYSGAQNGIAGAVGGWYDGFWAATPSVAMLPTLDGRFPFARLGAPQSAPSLRRDSTWLAADNLTWTIGKHQLKVGGEFRYLQNRISNKGFGRGFISSGNIGEFTSDSETCNTALVGGVPCGQAFLRPSFDYALNQQPDYNGLFNSTNFALYAQDAWKLHKNVQVNAGVRYDYFGVPGEVNNQIWNYDATANGLVQQNAKTVQDPFGYACGSTPVLDAVVKDRSLGQTLGWSCKPSKGGNIIKPDFGNFSGRFGIAWDAFGDSSTVVRAGVGVFYDQTPITYMSQLLFNRPTPLNVSNPRYIYGQNFLGSSIPAGQTVPGQSCQQCGFGNSTAVPANLQTFFQSAASPFGLFARDASSSRTPYARQLNVTVQQQVNNNIVVEVGYVNAGGKRLPIVENKGFQNEWFCTNTRIPISGPGVPAGATAPACDNFSYFPVFTLSNVAESRYHSMMVRTRISNWHGIRVNGTYTWSRSRDNASSTTLPLVPTPLFTQAFGLQFFGLGNPFGFALGKVGNILGKPTNSVPTSVSIAGSDPTSSSVTTTGAGAVLVTPYSLPQDPNNPLTDEDARSDFDVSQRVVVDYSYDLPFGKQTKYWGGWTVSGIFVAQSGQPFTIFSGPLFSELTQRVSTNNVQFTGNPNNYIKGTFTLPATTLLPTSTPLNPVTCGYATGQPLYQGTAGSACIGNSRRNQFSGPAYMSFDVALQKSFKIFGEGKDLSFRMEAFNLFNRANFYNPISQISFDGINLNPDFGKIKSAKDPRQFQFAVRFSF